MSVVIVNWNLREDTIECLDSVFEMDYPAIDVIVVDNGSADGSVERIRQSFPQVRQLANAQNLGFAAAANQGIDLALARGYDYILLLNNDTVAAPDMMERLVAAGEQQRQFGILSPRILYFDQPDRTWQLASRWHTWLPMPVDIRQTDDTLLEADFVTGCGMLLRRALLQRVGKFDTRYFMYGEDVDLCARARRAGWRVAVVPEARLWHKVSASASKASAEMHYWRTRNRLLIHRHYRHGRLGVLSPVYAVLKAVVDWPRHLSRGQPAFIRPSLRGIWDGLRFPIDETD